MLTDHQSQRTWLAHIRHELSNPINTIIGYSGLLLEELEDETNESDSLLLSEIEKIQTGGNQLLSLLKTILAAEQLETISNESDLVNLIQNLSLAVQAPSQAVISHCQLLWKTSTPAIRNDLEKINKASQNLLEMIDKIVDQTQLKVNLTQVNIAKKHDLNCSEAIISELEINEKIKNSIAFLETDKNDEPILVSGTILVVDDNENNRDILSRRLKEQRYNYVLATNGEEAIEMIQSQDFDLILLDIIMPKMNGYQVLKWLHNSAWNYIPVIMISALDELDSVVKCIEMGAEDYLPKPFNPVLLKARINACLEKKRLRDQETLYLAQLAQANQEITNLNERLQEENIRLSAELEITQRLQQMILPREQELNEIQGLEIAGYMKPADEVGGDYYDVLQHNGRVKIGIGDVTGHGLESGVLMLMVQTAVRTLIESNERDPKKIFDILNRTIYKNVQRMSSDKNLTLSLADYYQGKLSLSGQHEEIIIVRVDGTLERIDTMDLGFPLGLEEKIADFINQTQIELNSGDLVILYTDGITEAENNAGQHYGIEQLCQIVQKYRQKPARTIRQIVIDDVRQHIGTQKIYDDITLVILKQK